MLVKQVLPAVVAAVQAAVGTPRDLTTSDTFVKENFAKKAPTSRRTSTVGAPTVLSAVFSGSNELQDFCGPNGVTVSNS
jgi:hypothetical protein